MSSTLTRILRTDEKKTKAFIEKHGEPKSLIQFSYAIGLHLFKIIDPDSQPEVFQHKELEGIKNPRTYFGMNVVTKSGRLLPDCDRLFEEEPYLKESTHYNPFTLNLLGRRFATLKAGKRGLRIKYDDKLTHNLYGVKTYLQIEEMAKIRQAHEFGSMISDIIYEKEDSNKRGYFKNALGWSFLPHGEKLPKGAKGVFEMSAGFNVILCRYIYKKV